MRELPARLVKYLPKGHRLWFALRQDPELAKPEGKRNANAQGGSNRRDWILCACGLGVRVEADAPVTEETWLEAINQCRMAVHSLKVPCPPVTLDGTEQVVRDVPLALRPEPLNAKGKKKLVEA